MSSGFVAGDHRRARKFNDRLGQIAHALAISDHGHGQPDGAVLSVPLRLASAPLGSKMRRHGPCFGRLPLNALNICSCFGCLKMVVPPRSIKLAVMAHIVVVRRIAYMKVGPRVA